MPEIFKDLNKQVYTSEPLSQWETYCVRFNLSEIGRNYYVLGDLITDFTAQAIDTKFKNNSYLAYQDILGRGRPASAFYILLGGKLHILWGLVDKQNGEAKLHNSLREDFLFKDRDQNPKSVRRSGHIGTVTLPGFSTPVRAAVIDSLETETRKINQNIPEYFISTTLLENKILPLTSDGYPILLQ